MIESAFKLPSIAKHAAKHGISPIKKLGQNFIFDSTLCDKILRISGVKEGDVVLEIGPGTAGLTRSILTVDPSNLTVIETDSRCIPLLQEIADLYPSMNILQQDACKFDIASMNSHEIHIVSNLPYQIGTELLIKWLKKSHLISTMTLMLQKEVVERICANLSTKAYGRLSVICQLVCKVEKCFDVSPKAFYPPPKVDSKIVRLIPFKPTMEHALIEVLELVTRLAFSERRKMIKSSLKKLSPLDDMLKILDIDGSLRAENLSPQQYYSLSELFLSLKKD